MTERIWNGGEDYSWENAFVYLRSRFGLNSLLSMYVDVDSKNTSRRIIYVRKQTLSLSLASPLHNFHVLPNFALHS